MSTATIGVVTDSSCDLPGELAERWGIEIVPLSIRFGDEELIDREQLTTDEFWARCAATSELPATAAPAPGRFEEAYRRLAERGSSSIVAVILSGALSATLQSAELAARSVADDGIDVRVVDSRTVSLGLGMIALACAERGAAGDDLDTVEQLAARPHRPHAGVRRPRHARQPAQGRARRQRQGAAGDGAVDQADHRGRATASSRSTASNGRGSKALAFLVEKVAAYGGRMEHLAVLHADCDDVDAFVDRLRPLIDGDIVVGQIGPVIGTHAGRGTIGVAFHAQSEQDSLR